MAATCRRGYGVRSKEYAEAVRRFGDWLNAHGYYRDAASHYELASYLGLFGSRAAPLEVIDLLQLSAKNSVLSKTTRQHRNPRLKVLATQRRWATSASFKPVPRPPPQQLALALNIAESLPNDRPLLNAEILRDTGDWCVAFSISRCIESSYASAATLLPSVDDGQGLDVAWFSGAAPIYLMPLHSRDLSDDADAPQGHVDVRFTVQPNGITEGVVIIGSRTAGS